MARADAGKYTIFGHVIDGMDTLDKMEKIPSAGDTKEPLCCLCQVIRTVGFKHWHRHCLLGNAGVRGDRPVQEIRLNKVTIHANPLAG